MWCGAKPFEIGQKSGFLEKIRKGVARLRTHSRSAPVRMKGVAGESLSVVGWKL
jgi:hypothetical protein